MIRIKPVALVMIPPAIETSLDMSSSHSHCLPSQRCLGRPRNRAQGFTLIELLTVIGIMVLMFGLAMPAIHNLKSGGDFTHSVNNLAGFLEQGRAYAIANGTHVFVGIMEVDASQSASAIPQDAATGGKGGRVIAAAVASRDGTRTYDNTAPGTLNSASLITLGKAQHYEELHLTDLYANATVPSTGRMARQTVAPASRVGNAQCVSLTPFAYPLGGATKYTFATVIEFEPQGGAKIVSSSGGLASKLIEIGIQPTHQNAIPLPPADQNLGNHAAIQLDGLSGSIRVYRP